MKSSVLVTFVVATQLDQNVRESVVVYPTITNDLVYVKSNAVKMNLVIYNLAGKELERATNVSSNTSFSLQGQPKGAYLIMVNADGRSVIRRVIKQ